MLISSNHGQRKVISHCEDVQMRCVNEARGSLFEPKVLINYETTRKMPHAVVQSDYEIGLVKQNVPHGNLKVSPHK